MKIIKKTFQKMAVSAFDLTNIIANLLKLPSGRGMDRNTSRNPQELWPQYHNRPRKGEYVFIVRQEGKYQTRGPEDDLTTTKIRFAFSRILMQRKLIRRGQSPAVMTKVKTKRMRERMETKAPLRRRRRARWNHHPGMITISTIVRVGSVWSGNECNENFLDCHFIKSLGDL